MRPASPGPTSPSTASPSDLSCCSWPSSCAPPGPGPARHHHRCQSPPHRVARILKLEERANSSTARREEGPGRRSSGPSPCPYSPECVEGVFSELELRVDGVLGSSPHASNPKQRQRYAVWVMCRNAQSCYRASQQRSEATKRVPRTWAPVEGVGSQWCNRLYRIDIPWSREGSKGYGHEKAKGAVGHRDVDSSCCSSTERLRRTSGRRWRPRSEQEERERRSCSYERSDRLSSVVRSRSDQGCALHHEPRR